MNLEELKTKLSAIDEELTEIRTKLDDPEASTDELETRSNELIEERAGIVADIEKAEAAIAEEKRAMEDVITMKDVKSIEEEERKEDKTMFGIDTLEYRNAWVKNLVKQELSEEERSALTSAGAVIPTMTVNEVWDKLVKDAELLAKVDVTQFPNYVRFPKATTNNAATAQAVGSTITESSDVVGYVDLIPNEYVKLLTVGADIDHMAIDAIHTWIVDNLTANIRYAINKDILVGTGTNALKGITASVNADATPIPSSVTKASLLKIMGALPGQYQGGAIWIMTPTMFYENVLTQTTLNDYIINDGFAFKLFGHDVVLMSEALVSSKETIFYGDPKAYKVNIFKPLEVKPFETATTTNIQFRGACLADGELLDTSAFVRFAQS